MSLLDQPTVVDSGPRVVRNKSEVQVVFFLLLINSPPAAVVSGVRFNIL